MGSLAFSLIVKFGGTVINAMLEPSFTVAGRVVIQYGII
jgi:hypothetical protein